MKKIGKVSESPQKRKVGQENTSCFLSNLFVCLHVSFAIVYYRTSSVINTSSDKNDTLIVVLPDLSAVTK